jgi:hypothetical protein
MPAAQAELYLLAPAARGKACETIGCVGDNRVRWSPLPVCGMPTADNIDQRLATTLAIGPCSRGMREEGLPDVNGRQYAAACILCDAATTSYSQILCHTGMLVQQG